MLLITILAIFGFSLLCGVAAFLFTARIEHSGAWKYRLSWPKNRRLARKPRNPWR
jgi:hypothetical protein